MTDKLDIGMINTSLRTGQPLPQVTPCPLLDRFLARQHGLAIYASNDFGSADTPEMSVLEDAQYLCVIPHP
jgi:hypothetical protein